MIIKEVEMLSNIVFGILSVPQNDAMIGQDRDYHPVHRRARRVDFPSCSS